MQLSYNRLLILGQAWKPNEVSDHLARQDAMLLEAQI